MASDDALTIQAILARLPHRHASLVRAIFWDGTPQVVIAKRMRVTTSRISALKAEALDRFREQFEAAAWS